MKKALLLSAFIFFVLSLHAQTLVFRANPVAEIVLPEDPAKEEQHAASELQHWIQAITEAQLPIVRKASTHEDLRGVRLFIGTSFAKGQFDKDLEKIGSTDGFAVRRAKHKDGYTAIYLFGAIPRGTIHAVYAFLEANTDIIWARPNVEFGTVYSKQHTLNAKKVSFISVPKSTLRGWG